MRIARQHAGSMLSELVPMPRDKIDQPDADKQPVRRCHTGCPIPLLQAHDTPESMTVGESASGW